MCSLSPRNPFPGPRLVHSDLLPARTLPKLMTEFDGKLPYAPPEGKRLLPLWCFKYTALIRDRGVLADKGLVRSARLDLPMLTVLPLAASSYTQPL